MENITYPFMDSALPNPLIVFIEASQFINIEYSNILKYQLKTILFDDTALLNIVESPLYSLSSSTTKYLRNRYAFTQ